MFVYSVTCITCGPLAIVWSVLLWSDLRFLSTTLISSNLKYTKQDKQVVFCLFVNFVSCITCGPLAIFGHCIVCPSSIWFTVSEYPLISSKCNYTKQDKQVVFCWLILLLVSPAADLSRTSSVWRSPLLALILSPAVSLSPVPGC